MPLTWFSKSNYKNTAEVFSAIKKELKALWNKVDNTPENESSVSSQQSATLPETSSPAPAYTGMFYIHAKSNADNTEITIQVMYGTDFNKGDGSIAIVNGEVFRLNAWSETVDTLSEKYVFLKYTPEGSEDTKAGEAASAAKVEICIGDDLLDDTEDNAFYFIGKVRNNGNAIAVEQWHTVNIARFYHGIPCVSILEVPNE